MFFEGGEVVGSGENLSWVGRINLNPYARQSFPSSFPGDPPQQPTMFGLKARAVTVKQQENMSL